MVQVSDLETVPFANKGSTMEGLIFLLFAFLERHTLYLLMLWLKNFILIIEPIVVSYLEGEITHFFKRRRPKLLILDVGFNCKAFILGLFESSWVLDMDWIGFHGAILGYDRRGSKVEYVSRHTLELFMTRKGLLCWATYIH